jgi:hypothetical protein
MRETKKRRKFTKKIFIQETTAKRRRMSEVEKSFVHRSAKKSSPKTYQTKNKKENERKKEKESFIFP